MHVLPIKKNACTLLDDVREHDAEVTTLNQQTVKKIIKSTN
jgi:hypothetical protein